MFDDGLFKKRSQRDLNPKMGGYPRNDLRRQKGVAADFKEIVMNPYSLDAQHFRPNLRQGLFGRCTRTNPFPIPCEL